jgi:hypothetical protein
MSAARSTEPGVCTAQCRHIQIHVSRTSYMLHRFGASSLYSASPNTETLQINQTTCVTRRIHRESMIPRYRYFQEVTRILWKEQNVYFWKVKSVRDFFTKLIWELSVATFMNFLLLSAHVLSPSFIDETPKHFEYKTHFPKLVFI